MHLHEKSVSPAGGRGERHRDDQVAHSRSMRRVDNDGQVGLPLHVGNCIEIKRVARRSFERAYAPFAQDDLFVACCEQIFSCEEKILDLGCKSPLQEHGLVDLAHCLQQREILHVSRTNLDHVRLLGDHGYVGRVHDFGDDGKSKLVTNLAQRCKPFRTVPLE